MIERIVVPLDGFPYAEQALPHAVSLARRTGARVHLVHVLEMLMRPPYADAVPSHEWWTGRAREVAQRYLETEAGVVAALGVQVEISLLEGKPINAILGEARRARADMVVMTTHGRGPLGRLWLGSVADQMANQADLPVLFVRVGEAGAIAPARFEHLLVPLDGSPLAEAALDPALEIATLDRARLTLLSIAFAPGVVIPLLQPNLSPALALSSTPAVREVATVRDYLELVRESLQDYGVRIDTEVSLSVHAPAVGIARYAEMHEVDLLVLATRGHGLLRSLLGASVTDATVRRARVPVLVLPQP